MTALTKDIDILEIQILDLYFLAIEKGYKKALILEKKERILEGSILKIVEKSSKYHLPTGREIYAKVIYREPCTSLKSFKYTAQLVHFEIVTICS